MLLEVDQVRGGYGGKDVVKGVSCSADAGEVLCLLGPNGCGKTTLFRLLLGLLPITGGSIRLDGQDVRAFSPRELASRIAYIPQYHTPVFSYTVPLGPLFHLPRPQGDRPRGRLCRSGKTQRRPPCQPEIHRAQRRTAPARPAGPGYLPVGQGLCPG